MKITLNQQEVTEIVMAYIEELGLPLEDKNISIHQVPDSITVVINKDKPNKETKKKQHKTVVNEPVEVKEPEVAEVTETVTDKEDNPTTDTSSTKSLFSADTVIDTDNEESVENSTSEIPRKLFG